MKLVSLSCASQAHQRCRGYAGDKSVLCRCDCHALANDLEKLAINLAEQAESRLADCSPEERAARLAAFKRVVDAAEARVADEARVAEEGLSSTQFGQGEPVTLYAKHTCGWDECCATNTVQAIAAARRARAGEN